MNGARHLSQALTSQTTTTGKYSMRTIILVLMLIGAIMLNVATVAVDSVSSTMSSIYDVVSGIDSVRTRQAGELKSAKAKMDAKGKQVSELEKQLDVRTKRVQHLEGEVRTTRSELDLHTKRVTQLEGELANVKPREVNFRGRKRLLGDVVEETSERVARRTATGASRDVASTFAEGIPILGIAVIVGSTAWSVKSDCDTMQDLHDLDVALDPSNANSTAASEVCGLQVPTKEEVWAKVKASPGEAWAAAKSMMPELPAMPELPEFDWPTMPDFDWLLGN